MRPPTGRRRLATWPTATSPLYRVLTDHFATREERYEPTHGPLFGYAIHEKRTLRLAAEATSVQVCYDYEAKRSITVPRDLRGKIEAYEGHSLARADRAPKT